MKNNSNHKKHGFYDFPRQDFNAYYQVVQREIVNALKEGSKGWNLESLFVTSGVTHTGKLSRVISMRTCMVHALQLDGPNWCITQTKLIKPFINCNSIRGKPG